MFTKVRRLEAGEMGVETVWLEISSEMGMHATLYIAKLFYWRPRDVGRMTASDGELRTNIEDDHALL